jgi:tRNA-binding EMAP/Myf-like protein
MEKLAVIAKVLELAPIEGADRIERATVLGWHVVVKKGLHKVGDLVVMVFPDSYAPKRYVDETYVGDEKVRIKTVKMRGQYSAGLVLPLYELTQAAIISGYPPEDWQEGMEVSVPLGIEKWVAPASASTDGETLADFPTRYISKTDELNFRSEPEALLEARTDPRFKNVEFVATLKCDGTSATYIQSDGMFHVCGRNREFKDTPGNVYWEIAKKYKLEGNLPDGYAIQGEICGPGIQKNPLKTDRRELFVFGVKNIRTHEWLGWDALLVFCAQLFVPTVREITRFVFTMNTPSLEDLQELANDTKYDNGRSNAEGVVIKPAVPISSKVLQKSYWSLKVMNQPYDMKKG